MYVRATIEALGTSRGNGRSRHVTALIDPGSDRSIISRHQLPTLVQRQLQHFQSSPSSPNPCNIRFHQSLRISTVTAETTQDCASLTTTIRLGDWSGDCDFLIFEHYTGPSLILGADFIRQNQLTIDFSSNNEKIVVTAQTPSTVCVATSSINIPPNAEMHIETSLARVTLNRVVTVEPFDHSKQGFVVANSVNGVRADGRSIVRVINPTNHSVRVHQGQPLALATPFDPNRLPITVARSDQASDLEDHLSQLNVNQNLNTQDRESVLEVIRRYANAFGWTPSDFGRTDLVEHHIQLTTNRPIKAAAYKTQPHKQHVIDEKVAEMLQQGIIEESRSPFSSPVVLARKRVGSGASASTSALLITSR